MTRLGASASLRRGGRCLASVAAIVLAAAACGSDEPKLTTIAIDGRPSAVALAGGHVWVADDVNHTVHVIKDDADVRSIDVKRNPIALAHDGTGIGYVWVAHASGSVARIHTATFRARSFRIGGSLTSITVAAGRVWATDLEHDDLVEIDADSGRVRDRIHMKRGAVRVAADGRYLWVTGREHHVTRLEIDTGRTKVYDVGEGPIGVVAAPDDDAWVANSDDDTIELARREVSYDVGRAPVSVAVLHRVVWSANQDDGTLTGIDTDDGGRVSIDLGTHPRGMAAAYDALWVVGTNPEAVVRVEP